MAFAHLIKGPTSHALRGQAKTAGYRIGDSTDEMHRQNMEVDDLTAEYSCDKLQNLIRHELRD
ncbi:MAG: hypothetical protein HW412_1433 [Bacteroidetes bacterium]|nr:hypothetical protein [Bacteroidota bacterium]